MGTEVNMPVWLTEAEEKYARCAKSFPMMPLCHYESAVWKIMRDRYPNMTVAFWEKQQARVALHHKMGLTVDRSVDELKPFAEAQLNQRRCDLVSEFRRLYAASKSNPHPDGCFFCGSHDHRSEDCMNRDAK
jgi:hypothetical protein